MPVIHLHLDALGGVAGDMFTAALLDAFPEYSAEVIEAAHAVAKVPCSLLPHRDAVLTGKRFIVDAPNAHLQPHDHVHHHHHDQASESPGHGHVHFAWRDIRFRIEAAALPHAVRATAIGIFTGLAEAEARVHGIAVDEVSFHEVGSADSIADIIAAAWLIRKLDGAVWSVGPLPLGGGRVKTAHGVMPVPAPATALLLEGFAVTDDGVDGERVTPTGAAILRYLAPASRGPLSGRIARNGFGFGARRLPGMSNVLRVLAFEDINQPQPIAHRDLTVIGFEVDDQSGEDLASGLDRLRQLPGVLDVLQMPAFGKKGRMATHVQVLTRPDALEEAIEACFRETTTIGLRAHLVHGRTLPRDVQEVEVDGQMIRVKSVERPGGRTRKAEADDVLKLSGHAARAGLRRMAEQLAERTEDA
jgi:uncharacterized protein (TIGR00299 family) protein